MRLHKTQAVLGPHRGVCAHACAPPWAPAAATRGDTRQPTWAIACIQMYMGYMQRDFEPPDPDEPAATRSYLKQVSSRERPSMAS
jgi:hypothetical protein